MRLVDADVLKVAMYKRATEMLGTSIVCEVIDNAPTISPYKAIHDELHKGEEE